MNILITGGTGFLGRHLTSFLEAWAEEHSELAPSKIRVESYGRELDLMNPGWYDKLSYKPHVIYHLAARVGGIEANRKRPGEFFYENMQMGMNVLEGARQLGATVILIGTTCSYPAECETPFHPRSLWSGYPEATNAPYGVAKRALITMAEAYHEQYGVNTLVLIPANLYGPGDNFDLENSHVVPGMIRRFIEAVEAQTADPARVGDSIALWGDGQSTRELLFVDDAARMIAHLGQLYAGLSNSAPLTTGIVSTGRRFWCTPINLGSGDVVSIADLAQMIKQIVGFRGVITWDGMHPNGQRHRQLDLSSQIAHFLRAEVPLVEGLKRTVDWYLMSRKLGYPV